MTETLFLDDSYLKECQSTVKSVDANKVVLDKTIFYATSGGQPNDTGFLIKDGKNYKVTNASKIDGEIVHEIEDYFNNNFNSGFFVNTFRRY